MKKIVLIIVIMALTLGAVSLVDVELKDDKDFSTADDQNIGVLTRALWVLRKEYAVLDAERAAAMAVYEGQLRAKQAEIEVKEAELLSAQEK